MTINANVQVTFEAEDELDAERLVETWQLHEGTVVQLSTSATRTATADASGHVELELPALTPPPLPGQPPIEPPVELVAEFTYTPPAPQTNETITFDASASTGALRYDWDFGDGDTLADAGPFVEHAYDKKGANTVTLTVADDATTDQATDTITIT